MAGERPVPYPAEVRAKGWRFEIDHERIEQSDTWALAPAVLRPWLLMLWLTAWRQTPCGSLPNNDALIAARIGMPMNRFVQDRAILLRGWWVADDGRLYHDTISDCVLAMLAARAKERDRKANFRGRGSRHVPRDNDGTTTGPNMDTDGTTKGVTAPEPEPEPEPGNTSPDGDGGKPAAAGFADPCPHQKIIDLYHRLLPMGRQVRVWTDKRSSSLRARWREDPKRQNLGWWERFFAYCAKSKFLTGQVPPSPGHKQFEVSLDRLITADFMAKVIEGAYHDAEEGAE